MSNHPLPSLTLRSVLERSAALFADRPALSSLNDTPLTYSDVYESTQTITHWLREHGVGFGDKVVILSENCSHWGVVYFAVTCMGAVAVPILTEFHSDAICHIIRHSEAKAVFVSEKLLSKIEDAEFDPTPLFINIETFSPIALETARDTIRELKSAGLREFRKWKEKALALGSQPTSAVLQDGKYRGPEEGDLAAIIYTSGTTGHSKGVMLSHKNIVSNAVGIECYVDINENDRLLSILPLPHTYECTLGLVLPILRGAQVVYIDKPPTARVLLPALGSVKPTAMLAVPLIMEKIFKTSVLPKLTANPLLRFFYRIPLTRRFMHRAAGKKLLVTFGGQLRLMTIGGAPLAGDAELFLREAGFPYAIGYGLTETSPLISGSSTKNCQLYSAGTPLVGTQVRIADKNPRTGEGEIQVIGPGVMQGYYKAPEITADVMTEDGWLRTGDLGTLDCKGYVTIRGRLKNVVIGPSGENIYPEEIESFFFASPYVLEVLVYGYAGKLTARVHLDTTKLDDLFGNLPAPELAQKTCALLENIKDDVNGKVSNFSKIQRIIEQTEPFEKTPTQKIKRYLYVDS